LDWIGLDWIGCPLLVVAVVLHLLLLRLLRRACWWWTSFLFDSTVSGGSGGSGNAVPSATPWDPLTQGRSDPILSDPIGGVVCFLFI